jgi:hypothetical protein
MIFLPSFLKVFRRLTVVSNAGEGMVWPVPVVRLAADRSRRQFRIWVLDGDVVVQTPDGTIYEIPPSSDTELCDAIREARNVANHMGRGLS